MREKNMPNALHSVSVAAVIVDDRGRALLIRRRDNQRWEPPGGVLELGEDIRTGLCREALEETGLNVEPVALTGVYKNMKRGIVALVFRCRVASGQLTLNDEVSGFRWATPDEVTSAVDEAFAVRIADALSNSAVPAVRQHDGTHLL
jgi:ADP-ribose pyrophosphatase YjhB (NUDIX family)